VCGVGEVGCVGGVGGGGGGGGGRGVGRLASMLHSNLMLPWNVHSWVKFQITVTTCTWSWNAESERNNYLAGYLRSEVLSEAPSTNSLQNWILLFIFIETFRVVQYPECAWCSPGYITPTSLCEFFEKMMDAWYGWPRHWSCLLR